MLLNLTELIQKHGMKITGAIVVGAHEFSESEEYIKNGVKDFVLIEPSPPAYQILIEKFGKNTGYFIGCFACGAKIEESQMFVETKNKGQSNSILRPSKHTEQYPDILFEETRPVHIFPLDFVVEHPEKYNFLSMDVQCYEMEVLKGAKETLRHIDYIMSEVNAPGASLYENCTDITQMDYFLGDHGFQRVEEPKWIGGSWADSLWIRKTLLK